ncbi:MAG: hypothetical protein H0U91_13430 [Rubrobacter sp.]|nr:hypothetical protein [Rubrobacter sp.]
MTTTTERAGVRPDLWGEPREWEEQYGPGELLDQWREACDTLEALAGMSEGARTEMLYIAFMDALKRAREERAHFEEEVRMRLSWNKAHGKLTYFGRVLKPLMESAGLGSVTELLIAAGRIEEPHATEKLERLMHGPETKEGMAGYLDGFSEALGLPEGEEGDRQRTRLSSTLIFMHPDVAEKAAREAEEEASEDYMPPPAPDAYGPLSEANRALSDAIDRLEGTDDECPEVLERKRRAGMAISEAGMLVASEQRRQQEEAGR